MLRLLNLLAFFKLTQPHNLAVKRTTANQRQRPALSSVSYWFRPRCHHVNIERCCACEINVCFHPTIVGAPVQPRIFFSRTIKYFGRICDQIGHTLEPCSATSVKMFFSADVFTIFIHSLRHGRIDGMYSDIMNLKDSGTSTTSKDS